MYVFSFRSVASSDATFTVIPTTKFRTPTKKDIRRVWLQMDTSHLAVALRVEISIVL